MSDIEIDTIDDFDFRTKGDDDVSDSDSSGTDDSDENDSHTTKDSTHDTRNSHPSNIGGKIRPTQRHDMVDDDAADCAHSGGLTSHSASSHQSHKLHRQVQRASQNTHRTPPTSTPTHSTALPSTAADLDDDDGESITDETTPEAVARLASYAYLSADLSCGICGLFMYRPVTLLCGHSCCQLCLQTYIERNSSPQCPVPRCGECLPVDCSRNVCTALNNALEHCFPAEYAISKMHSEAIAAIQVGSDDVAVSLLTESLKQWPDAFHLYSNRLCCHLRLCQFDNAVNDVPQLINLQQRMQVTHVKRADGTDGYEMSSPVPAHQTSYMLHTLSALGQAGIITRIYKLAIYAFASALRLSPSQNAQFDREKIAHKLIDAYLGERKATAPITSSTFTDGHALPGSSQPLVSTALTAPPVSPLVSTFLFPAPAALIACVTHSHSLGVRHNHGRGIENTMRALCDRPTSAAIRAEFQCLLCMCTLYEPVSTICGHTFCRLCLARSLDHKNLCPFCRVSLSLHISPTRQAVNLSIRSLLQRWCQEAYEKRHELIVAELAEQSLFLPMFICTLMFPGVSCPLHIFEPRYRLMVRSVLESGYNRMGMVLSTDKDNQYAGFGCTAEIRNVRLLADGRSLVDTVGGRRFRVKERSSRNGYDTGRIEWLDDISEEEERAKFGNAQPSITFLLEEVFELVNEMLLPRLLNSFDIESQLGVMPPMSEPTKFAYWLCAVLPLPLDKKYEFLQVQSQYERYTILYQTLLELENTEFC